MPSEVVTNGDNLIDSFVVTLINHLSKSVTEIASDVVKSAM